MPIGNSKVLYAIGGSAGSVPVFTLQPIDVYDIDAGETAVFTAAADDTNTWQWEVEDPNESGTWTTDLATVFGGRASGITTDTLTITGVDVVDNRGVRVVATGSASITSNEVVLFIASNILWSSWTTEEVA